MKQAKFPPYLGEDAWRDFCASVRSVVEGVYGPGVVFHVGMKMVKANWVDVDLHIKKPVCWMFRETWVVSFLPTECDPVIVRQSIDFPKTLAERLADE